MRIILITCMLMLASLAGAAQNVAVKTNLLYDATATINLGAEVGLAPRWTAELGGNFNNWAVNRHLWKHWMVQPELRYWLCERFGGHFFGVHLIAGEYNFGNMSNSFKMFGSDFSGLSDKRYQGWAAGAGAAYGYAWVLSRRLNIEAEIGLGWLYTRYDVYPCANCGSRLQKNKTHNYVGPTKAAVNLVYTF